jgi:hypothetical protein
MLRKIFTKYLVFLLISLFGLGFILAYLFGDEQPYTVSKTVGWAYDISDQAIFAAFIFAFSQILFIIGYFLIFVSRRKTNYYFSIAHFEIIILTLALMSFENFMVNMIFLGLSIVLFLINVCKSHK